MVRGSRARSAKRLCALVLLWACSSAAPGATAGQDAPPGQLVDVGSHKMHIQCVGSGGPTVVMDAGLGGTILDWSRVQPLVAGFTRVCAYDRSGYGWSEASPNPRSSVHIADELHALLHESGVEPPYVLVVMVRGHPDEDQGEALARTLSAAVWAFHTAAAGEH